MSSSDYNRRVGLLIACPITNQQKGYAYEVAIPDDVQVTGVVMADQAKSVDRQRRGATFRCRMPDIVVDEVLNRVISLIEA